MFQCAPDKSLTHRLLIFFAATPGRHSILNPLKSKDTLATLEILRQLGVVIEERNIDLTRDCQTSEGGASLIWIVHGKPLALWELQPNGVLDCKNSGTTLRLMTGLMSGMNGFRGELTGDDSLLKRPMGEVVDALIAAGARINANEGRYAPVQIDGQNLKPIDHTLKSQSAQVKSALLLASWSSKIPCTLSNYKPVSRNHTENLLSELGVTVQHDIDKNVLSAKHKTDFFEAKNLEMRVPSDPSSVAFLAALCLFNFDKAAFHSQRTGKKLVFRRVLLNRTRTGFFEILKTMGAPIVFTVDRSEQFSAHEPVGSIEIQSGGELKLSPLDYQPSTSLFFSHPPESLIDEFPLLVALCATIDGVSNIRGVSALRSKECDRIYAMTVNLRALGIKIEEHEDGWTVFGNPKTVLQWRELLSCPPKCENKIRVINDIKPIWNSFGDHRIEMVGEVLSLSGFNPAIHLGPSHVDISYPNFYNDLKVFQNFYLTRPTDSELAPLHLSQLSLDHIDRWLLAGLSAKEVVQTPDNQISGREDSLALHEALRVYKRGAHAKERIDPENICNTEIVFAHCLAAVFRPELWFENLAVPEDTGLIVDPTVWCMVADHIAALPNWNPQGELVQRNRVFLCVAEPQKNLQTACMLADQIKARPHVSHWMVMGGGSLLDLAGFVLGQTGIECSHIPTTLLAAVDAGLGGKTGVDYASFKNQIGGFYFPKQTVICKDFFSSLTIEMKASGLAEAMKHALLSADISLFQRLCQSDLASPEFITEEDLQAALLVKQAYVLLDPYEIKGLRTHLNFGHTYAHMIEALSLNTVPHGICVLWGLKVALELSIGEGHLEKNCGKSLLVDLQASTSWRILETYMQEFKTTLMELTEVQLSEKVSSILVQDKKKGEQSLLTEVLLKKGHDEEHPKPFTVQLKLPQLAAFFITQLQEFTNGRT